MLEFAEVIAAFGGPSRFGSEIGVKPAHARIMKWRNAIPARYWPKTVQRAAKLKIAGVTYESLARMAERRWPKRQMASAA